MVPADVDRALAEGSGIGSSHPLRGCLWGVGQGGASLPTGARGAHSQVEGVVGEGNEVSGLVAGGQPTVVLGRGVRLAGGHRGQDVLGHLRWDV